MRITRKIIQVGSSIGITLDNNLIREKNIQKGDYIEIETIRVIKKGDL